MVITAEPMSPPEPAAEAPLLSLRNLQVVYGGAIEAVRDVSLDVHAGRIVTLLGSNGAGKSTVLKAVSAVLDAEDGTIEKGSIVWNGRSIERASAPAIVAQGLVQVPEGRRLFGTLTVEENLLVGAHLQNRAALAEARDFVYGLFPRLADRRRQIAGYLSGGEQQMVAIGRALMGRPRLLALDEPSLGLAPLVVAEIFRTIVALREQTQLTILLVEQNAAVALSIAHRGYVLQDGRVFAQGPAAQLLADDHIRTAYLGEDEGVDPSPRPSPARGEGENREGRRP